MKKSIVAKAICLLTASIMLSVPGAFAKKGGGGGGGKGQTKIDFSLTLGNPATSRLFAKRDVAAGVAQLPEVGSASKNDNLAGQVVAVYFGDSLTTGTADSRGKVTVPFEAKLTANGRNMQVTIKGLDLETIMGINPLDGTYVTVVPLEITTTYMDPNTSLPVTVELSEEMVTFTYTVSMGKVKGRNF